jgi:signal transduction histidine kinase
MTFDDFSSDERVAAVAREHLGLGPAVVLPLGAPGNVRGILTAGRSRGSLPLAPPAVELLVSFAAQAGVGLELAAHRADAERLAVFEDRDRIARDLHDLVIQRLYATGMSLQSVSARMGDSDSGRRISSSVDALDETIKEIRAAIFSLHARPATEESSLRTKILEVIDDAAAALGFAPALRISGGVDDIPGDVAEHLLGALREALSNAARHAKASKVDVTVEANPGDLTLLVRDDGIGISGTGRRSGLDNLADRAALLGGTMRAGPGGDGGTELEWRVPLRAP